jgi:low affinity iron permease
MANATQNRDGAAIQAKLDELILVTAAENSFIGIEHLTEEEVNEFRKKCKTAAAMAEREGRSAVKRTRLRPGKPPRMRFRPTLTLTGPEDARSHSEIFDTTWRANSDTDCISYLRRLCLFVGSV